MEAAIRLFSEQSVSKVTTREIAKEVGIKPASLYSHFVSKDDILNAIYAFYERNAEAVQPDLEHLLEIAETEHPHSVLMKMNFHFDPSVQELMDRVVIIASVESRSDERSDRFVVHNMLELPVRYARRLLERMLELGRIEPLDIEAFVEVLANYCYSAALRNYTRHPVTYDGWYRGIAMLYQLVKPTGK